MDTFQFSRSNISGTIPTEIGLLTALTRLAVFENLAPVEEGFVPTEIFGLTNLRQLALRDLGLEGSIPTEITNLGRLQSLWLQNNDLTGTIPSSMCRNDIGLSLMIQFDCREIECSCLYCHCY